MNDIILVIGLILAIMVVIILTMARENQRREKFLQFQIKERWGTVPNREFTYEEFESVSHYSRRKKDKTFFVDDITWNDLDMDRIFLLMNNTMCSCGEEYLYDILRRPLFEKELLDKREELVEYFRTHEEERTQLQKQLAMVGRTSKNSIYDYMKIVNEFNQPPTSKHKVLACLGLLSLASVFLDPSSGVILFVGMLAINFVTYFKDKGEIEAYLKCFQCILRMMEATSEVSTNQEAILQPIVEKLKKANRNLSNFKRGSFLVTQTKSSSILDVILDYIKMFLHIDLIKFNSMLKLAQKHQDDIDTLFENLGILDSAMAIASFREYLPYYCVPNLEKSNKAKLNVVALYHPMIENPVANTLDTTNSILVTGSNASGKSTFLKNLAINTILAQTVHTCVSKSYQGTYMKVLTSMALHDDLESGDSYYIVEIKSLKRILEEGEKGIPMLCIVDEVLRGTNTIERIAASSSILQVLDQPHILSLAATHDIELSYILHRHYQNYHFEEDIKDGNVIFNYLLKKGRATSRNAIKLLEVMKYNETIVKNARKSAKDFEETGVWSNL